MNIDWSKAPEGATHFGPETSIYCAAWYRVDGDEVVSYLELDSTSSELKPAIHGSAYYHPLEDLESPWTGEGLPPVGTDVEVCRGDCSWIAKDEWQIGKTARVMSSFENKLGHGLAAIQFGSGHCECILAACLKPIRTPEQIAADEREAAIEEMWSIYWKPEPQTAKEALGLLWDAGYRKQEVAQ